MQAKALITRADQSFALETVTLPEVAPDQVAIKTAFTGVSIGTEFALIRNKISWGPYPLCTGYQGTGTITQVGAQVSNFKVGDQVYFRGNEKMKLADGTVVSPVAGTHCSHVVTKPNTTHGVAPILRGADLATASMFVMPAVGLYGADMANPRMGQVVVIYGCGLIGLGALAACVHRGCEVIAVDVSEKALAMAADFGADHLIRSDREDVGVAVRRIAPEGADVVFECTGIPACLDPAIALCRTQGSFVWQGNYGSAPVSLQFLPAHGRRLRMFFPCDDGWQPCRRAVVKNMAMGALKWERTITHRIGCQEAPAMFARINRGDREVVGVVIDWQNA